MGIRRCPTCKSRNIRRRVASIQATIRGKTSRVSDLELEVRPHRGEKLFDMEASRRMEQHFLLRRRGRAAATK